MSVKFIDISNWQRGIDVMSVVRNGGLTAVVVKATEGVGFVDKSCDGFVSKLRANGIRFGFYHFARSNSARAEAEFFRNNTRGYEKAGIPILDWEAGQSIAWVNEFVERYHELTGVWPWVYGNAWRFNQGTVNENCGRWVAGYPSNGITDINYGLNKKIPYKVNNGLVCAWQFSSSVRIAGYGGNLDGDVFYGDAAAWDRYAGGSPASSGPAQPSQPSGNAPSGSTLDLAVGVMQGRYGNGDARKSALGSRYDEVQAVINHISDASAQTLASEVWAGKYGDGGTRKAVLGSRYDEVMRVVNGSSSSKKSVAQLAQEVIAGKWGNGSDRKARLEAAGYDYSAVQAEVNHKLGASSGGSSQSPDIDQMARDVIAGKYGNGDARKKALGSNYDAVQRRVNELLGVSGGSSSTSSTSSSKTWKVGASVQFTSPYDEHGTHLAVSGTYTIMQINGSRIVVGRGGVVTAAVPKGNLRLV